MSRVGFLSVWRARTSKELSILSCSRQDFTPAAPFALPLDRFVLDLASPASSIVFLTEAMTLASSFKISWCDSVVLIGSKFGGDWGLGLDRLPVSVSLLPSHHRFFKRRVVGCHVVVSRGCW